MTRHSRLNPSRHTSVRVAAVIAAAVVALLAAGCASNDTNPPRATAAAATTTTAAATAAAVSADPSTPDTSNDTNPPRTTAAADTTTTTAAVTTAAVSADPSTPDTSAQTDPPTEEGFDCPETEPAEGSDEWFVCGWDQQPAEPEVLMTEETVPRHEYVPPEDIEGPVSEIIETPPAEDGHTHDDGSSHTHDDGGDEGHTHDEPGCEAGFVVFDEYVTGSDDGCRRAQCPAERDTLSGRCYYDADTPGGVPEDGLTYEDAPDPAPPAPAPVPESVAWAPDAPDGWPSVHYDSIEGLPVGGGGKPLPERTPATQAFADWCFFDEALAERWGDIHQEVCAGTLGEIGMSILLLGVSEECAIDQQRKGLLDNRTDYGWHNCPSWIDDDPFDDNPPPLVANYDDSIWIGRTDWDRDGVPETSVRCEMAVAAAREFWEQNGTQIAWMGCGTA